MENRTINVEVSYFVSENCQKHLVKLGLNPVYHQIMDIVMPIESLDILPVSIDGNGKMSLNIREKHYYITTWRTTKPELELVGHTSDEKCVCCGRSFNVSRISDPILTYQDVLDNFSGNKDRKIKSEFILKSQIEQSQKLEQIKNDLRVSITNELEQKYSRSEFKIGLI
jgi:hypothetical protein